MPSQNRPVVKDGRLVVKKRTDRSYLKPAATPDAAPSVADAEAEAAPIADDTVPTATSAATTAFTPPPPAQAPLTAAPAAAASAKSSTARALEQQGVRKRRDVDLDAVARRDSNYAVHELRRIAILTAIVLVALVVLTLTLR